MKPILLFVFAIVFFAGTINAQSIDSLQNQVLKLKKYYDSYDDGSAESLKKANYNDAINEISGGTATEKDKADAYKIIDWYIKSDKAIANDNEKLKPKQQADDLDQYLENTDEAKAAISYMEQQKKILLNMSYPEFEKKMLNANPVAGKKEMKLAYNQLHKNDGKQVPITDADEEMTETQKQVWAFDILNHPKNYEEFYKACKILNPNFPDSEIRKGWEQNKNK